MSIRMIQPDEIRVGQTIRITQRWPANGPMEPCIKSFRGVVEAVNPRQNSVALSHDGGKRHPFYRDTSEFTVEITLLAEPVDPRKDVIIRTLMTSLYITVTRETADHLADRILSNLDRMEDA